MLEIYNTKGGKMRTRKMIVGLLIITLIVAVLLMCIQAYYVAIALLAGIVLTAYREIWSLLKYHKLPVMDERIRENTGKSVRNGFIFLVVALAFLMLPFSSGMIERPSTATILGGLLVSGGAMYCLSYIFFDRVEPKLSSKKLKMFRIFILTAVISVPVFILGVFFHNAFDALFHVEEPVFFIIAVIVAPLGMATGVIGSLVMFIYGLLAKVSP